MNHPRRRPYVTNVHLSASHFEQLRVPVQRAQVEVHTEHAHRNVVIFLPPDSSPADFFENDAAFFPAEEGGAIRLFARTSVVSLVVDAGEAAPESLLHLGVACEERSIAVHLRNGEVIHGLLSGPFWRTRTLDIVNGPEKSLAIRAGGKVHHVAKVHVEHIEELG